MTLSEKMKQILDNINKCEKNGITQTDFIGKIHQKFKDNPDKAISESVLQKIFAGQKDDNLPTLPTIQRIVEFLSETYPKYYKDLSIEYLINDNITNINTSNVNINKKTGLNDEAIKELKSINKIYNNISNDFITNINTSFWKNIYILNNIKEYKKCCEEIKHLTYYDFIKQNNEFYNENINIIKKKLNIEDELFPFDRTAILNEITGEVLYTSSFDDFIDTINNLQDASGHKDFIKIWNNKELEEREELLKYKINQDIILYLNKE